MSGKCMCCDLGAHSERCTCAGQRRCCHPGYHAPGCTCTRVSSVTEGCPAHGKVSGHCPSDCDDDCDVACHESHQVPRRRRHSPDECPGAAGAKMREERWKR